MERRIPDRPQSVYGIPLLNPKGGVGHLLWRDLRVIMLNDRQVNPADFNHLTCEIGRVTDEQIEALRRATFGGMSDDEEREYENREKQLTSLVNELGVLMSNRTI